MTDFTPILRAFRKNPNVPLLVVAVLAIGAAANIALFSIVDRALLHPVAFRDPDRIFDVQAVNRQDEPVSFRHADFAVWPARVPAKPLIYPLLTQYGISGILTVGNDTYLLVPTASGLNVYSIAIP